MFILDRVRNGHYENCKKKKFKIRQFGIPPTKCHGWTKISVIATLVGGGR